MMHGLGGRHFILEIDGALAAHASVVERALELDGTRLRAGYVESVAVAPALQRRGLGTQLMAEATAHIRDAYELGALGTGEQPFYEPLGWERWAGRSFVRERDGSLRHTADEDPWLMVLRTGPSADSPLTRHAHLRVARGRRLVGSAGGVRQAHADRVADADRAAAHDARVHAPIRGRRGRRAS